MALKTHHDDVPTLNLTSLIDVLFLMIMFFMVGTRFADMERDVTVQVPRVQDRPTATAAPARRVINVYRDGRIAWERQFVTLEQLAAELAAAQRRQQGLGVVVRGDGEGSFQNVATVLNACRQAGIQDLGISVKVAQDAAAAGGTTRR